MLEERDPLPIGNRIRLTLHLGTETVSCTGLVKRSIPDEGMAVEFVDISVTDHKRLLEYLAAATGAESRARLNTRLGNASGRAHTIAPSASASAPAAKPPAPLPRLAGLLVQRGTITADQLAAAAAEYRQRGGRFSALLLQLGFVSDEDLAACFNEEYGIPLIDVTTAEPTPEALRLVPYKVARRHEILPIGVTGSTLTVATSDPSNLDGRNEVKFRSGCDLRVAVALSRAVREAIAYFYRERARDAG
jgi:MshEN domain/PilZ domain